MNFNMNKLKFNFFNIEKIDQYFNILNYFDLKTEDFDNDLKNIKLRINNFTHKKGIFDEKKKMILKLKEINERLNKYDSNNKRKKKDDLFEKKELEDKLKRKIKKDNDIIGIQLQYLIILNKIHFNLKKYSSNNKDYNCENIIKKLNYLKKNNKSMQFYYFYIKILKYIIKNYHNSNASKYYSDIIEVLFDKNYDYLKQKNSTLILLLKAKEKNFLYEIPISTFQRMIEYFVFIYLINNCFKYKYLNILKEIIVLYTNCENYLENNSFIFEFLFDFFQILILKFIININNKTENIIESIKICYEILFIIIKKKMLKRINKLNYGKLLLIEIYSNEIIKKKNENYENTFFADFFDNKKYLLEILLDLLTRDNKGFYQKVINSLGLEIKEKNNNYKFTIFFNFNEELCKISLENINNFLEFDENKKNFIQRTFEFCEGNILTYLFNKINELIENYESELLNKYNLNLILIKILDIVKATKTDITDLIYIIINKKGEDLKLEWDYIFQIVEIIKDNINFCNNKSKIFNKILKIYLTNQNNFYLNFYENCSKFIQDDDKLMDSYFEVLKVKILTYNYEKFSKNVQNLFDFYNNEMNNDKNNKIYYEDSFIYLMKILYLYLKKNINFENISNFIKFVLMENFNKLLNICCLIEKNIMNSFNYYLVKILLTIFNKELQDLNLFNFIINIMNEIKKENENPNLIFLKMNFYEILYEKFTETNNYLIIKYFSINFKIFLENNIEENKIFDNILNLIKNKFYVDHNYKIYSSKFLFLNQSPNIFYKFVSKINDNEIIIFDNDLLLTYVLTIIKKENNITMIEKILDTFEKKFQYLYFFKGLDFSELIEIIFDSFTKLNYVILEKIFTFLSNIAFHILLYRNEPNYIEYTQLSDIKLKKNIIQKLNSLLLLSIANKNPKFIIKTLKINELYFYSFTNSSKRNYYNNFSNIFDLYNQSEKTSFKFPNLNDEDNDFQSKCNNIIENICKILLNIPSNIILYFSILKFFYINRENFCQSFNQKNIILIIYITLNIYLFDSENINFDIFKNFFSEYEFPKIQKVEKNLINIGIYKIIKEFSSIILLYYIDKSIYINNIYKIINKIFINLNQTYFFDLIKWKLFSKIERDNRALNLFKNNVEIISYNFEKSKFYKSKNVIYEIISNDNNENIINIRTAIYNINMKFTKNKYNNEKNILKNPYNKKKFLYYYFIKELNNNPDINIKDKFELENNNNITNDDLNETNEIFSFFYSFVLSTNKLNPITTESSHLVKYIYQLDKEYSIYYQFNCDITYVSNEAIENECILNPLKSYEIKNNNFIYFLNSLGNIIKSEDNKNLLFFYNDNLIQINFNVKNFKSNNNNKNNINNINNIYNKIHILFLENIYKEIDIHNLNENILIYILIIPSINSHYLIKFVINKKFKKLNEHFIKDFDDIFLESTNIYVNDNFEILSDFIIKHIILFHYFIYFHYPHLYNNNFENRNKIINEIKSEIN